MILYHVPKNNTLYAHICIIIKIYIDVCVCTRELQQKRSKSSWKAPLPFRLMDLMAKRIPRTNSFIVFSALPTIYYVSGLICFVFMIPACPSVSQRVSQLFISFQSFFFQSLPSPAQPTAWREINPLAIIHHLISFELLLQHQQHSSNQDSRLSIRTPSARVLQSGERRSECEAWQPFALLSKALFYIHHDLRL